MHKPLLLLAVAAALSVSVFQSPAKARVDPTLLWLGAGEHNAPCDAGLRCASRLDCDPDELRCQVPGWLEVNVADVTGCTPNLDVTIKATNKGEIAVEDEVAASITFTGGWYPAECFTDQPGFFADDDGCTWGNPLQGPMGGTYAYHVFKLAPGQAETVTLDAHVSLPTYILEATVSVEAEAATARFSVPRVKQWTGPFDDEGSDACY